MNLQDSRFDSQHYELRIGRLIPEPADGAIELAATLEAARQSFDLVFLRLAEHDPLRAVLEERGDVAIDTLVTSTLGADRRKVSGHAGIAIEHHEHPSEPDVAAIAAITATSITTSHLHADSRLPIERTRALYATWARNDATGRAQRTIVARSSGDVIGYLAVIEGPGTAMIDLVAVAPGWQGRGVGSTMLASFVDWIGERDLVVTVGTQAENPALGLYARFGFVPTARHFTYHLWLGEPR